MTGGEERRRGERKGVRGEDGRGGEERREEGEGVDTAGRFKVKLLQIPPTYPYLPYPLSPSSPHLFPPSNVRIYLTRAISPVPITPFIRHMNLST